MAALLIGFDIPVNAPARDQRANSARSSCRIVSSLRRFPLRAVSSEVTHDDTHASIGAVPRGQRVEPITPAAFTARAAPES